jgi:hypothetical protein
MAENWNCTSFLVNISYKLEEICPLASALTLTHKEADTWINITSRKGLIL